MRGHAPRKVASKCKGWSVENQEEGTGPKKRQRHRKPERIRRESKFERVLGGKERIHYYWGCHALRPLPVQVMSEAFMSVLPKIYETAGEVGESVTSATVTVDCRLWMSLAA